MSFVLEPVSIATGCDEEGVLVFDEQQRLVAVLTHLSEHNEVAPGQWYLEASFGPVDGIDHPVFVDLEAAQTWLCRRLAR